MVFHGCTSRLVRENSSCSCFVLQMSNECLLVQLKTVHGDDRGHSVDSIIPIRVVLPFCKDALPNQQPELGVAEPHRWQIQFMTDVFGDVKDAWAYFRGPDGFLYEIWQTQRPLKAPLGSG